MTRLTALAATLAEAGLRPIVDEELDLVISDCPDCQAERRDPLGMWRPMQVVPRGDRTTWWCQACGRRTERRSS